MIGIVVGVVVLAAGLWQMGLFGPGFDPHVALAELRKMAGGDGREVLTYLLEMTILEAQETLERAERSARDERNPVA